MPFKSRAQVRHMFREHPEIAREFLKETPNIRALPERVKSKTMKNKKKKVAKKSKLMLHQKMARGMKPKY